MSQSSGPPCFTCFLLSIRLCLLMKAGWCCEPSKSLLTQCIMFGLITPVFLSLKQTKKKLVSLLKLYNLSIHDLYVLLGKLNLIDSYQFTAQSLNSVFNDPSL